MSGVRGPPPPVFIFKIPPYYIYMFLNELVKFSQLLAQTSRRNEKISILINFLQRLEEQERVPGINFISGVIRQGKLNLGYRTLIKFLDVPYEKNNKGITLTQTDAFFDELKNIQDIEKRLRFVYDFFKKLSQEERNFLIALIAGELRQGAREPIALQAISKFFNIPYEEIEKLWMQEKEPGILFQRLLKQKAGKIEAEIQLFKPLRPMLAAIEESPEVLLNKHGAIALEYKLDGLRVQVHKKGDEIKIFSRHLRDITHNFPEIVDAVRRIDADTLILDGEAIAVSRDGKPLPFQILSRRITRKEGIDSFLKKIPVKPYFFDLLLLEGETLMDKEYRIRWGLLLDVVPGDIRIQRIVAKDTSEAEKFFEMAVQEGHEGVMAKLLDSPYKAGKRGRWWFKLKKFYTLDCVILAAEWGHGRRRGFLSNLHLGILDETGKKFLMVGKTFKGLTDEMLHYLTKTLTDLKIYEDRYTVYVKPEVVVEVRFNEVQKSRKYNSGYALRFARVKKIRRDKSPFEINNIIDLQQLTNIT